mgnify:CR=1 FL=1
MNGSKVEGLRWTPINEKIWVADYGQPDRSTGGLFLADHDFGGYKFDTWRYGEVVALGPGKLIRPEKRHAMPLLQLGDVVVFSRKHGTRLPGEVRYEHPKIKSKEGLLIRVLDPEKIVAVLPGFVPWWSVGDRQLDPSTHFSG